MKHDKEGRKITKYMGDFYVVLINTPALHPSDVDPRTWATHSLRVLKKSFSSKWVSCTKCYVCLESLQVSQYLHSFSWGT